MQDSPLSSENLVGINVRSDLEAALALGTSNSSDELECCRPRRTVAHKDATPYVAGFSFLSNSSPGQRAFCNPVTISAHSGTRIEVSNTGAAAKMDLTSSREHICRISLQAAQEKYSRAGFRFVTGTILRCW